METGDNMNQSTTQNAQTTGSANTTSNGTSQPAPVVTVDKNMLMGILSYLWVLVIIPFLMAKDDPFVKFHVKQGMVLVAIELILWVAVQVIFFLVPIVMIVNLGLLVLSIIGIINVVQGKEKELPLVGHFANKFNI